MGALAASRDGISRRATLGVRCYSFTGYIRPSTEENVEIDYSVHPKIAPALVR